MAAGAERLGELVITEHMQLLVGSDADRSEQSAHVRMVHDRLELRVFDSSLTRIAQLEPEPARLFPEHVPSRSNHSYQPLRLPHEHSLVSLEGDDLNRCLYGPIGKQTFELRVQQTRLQSAHDLDARTPRPPDPIVAGSKQTCELPVSKQ